MIAKEILLSGLTKNINMNIRELQKMILKNVFFSKKNGV